MAVGRADFSIAQEDTRGTDRVSLSSQVHLFLLIHCSFIPTNTQRAHFLKCTGYWINVHFSSIHSSISLWAFDILVLSLGVASPTYKLSVQQPIHFLSMALTSCAKSFIFSLKLSFAPSGGFPALNFFSCCSSNILDRGSLLINRKGFESVV